MPQVLTRDFGPLDYDPSSELNFPAGLPGFESEKRFILIEKDSLAPMVFLQSLVTPAVCFPTVPVQVVDPGYQIGMTEEDRRRLEFPHIGDKNEPDKAAADKNAEDKPTVDDPAQHALVLAILTSRPTWTANLLAPVVVNLRNKIGVQAVRADARYSHQHPLPEASAC